MKLNLDPDRLTFGDLEDYENVTGVPLMSVFDSAQGVLKLPAKQVTALVWICGRSEDPEFTYEQARQVPLTSIEVEVETPDPTDGSEKNDSVS